MNIVADENIPFARELFSQLGSVTLMPGRNITNADLQQCDVLIVRSVTKVNARVLEGAPVKFIGTCTIGKDHLDTDYLDARNITYASAPGCNANSVVQYVVCALSELSRLKRYCRVAVVGGGNVGSRMYKTFKALGFDCIVIDPFLNKDSQADLSTFDEVFSCDIVCLHTPLTRIGPHPTFHMFGYEELKKLKPGALLINAGRGEVIDNAALLKLLKENTLSKKPESNDIKPLQVVLDVWENEPGIDNELFDYLELGTPHIAGYSFEGKTNGSMMIFQSLASFLGKHSAWIEQKIAELKGHEFGDTQTIAVSSLRDALEKAYNIREDSDQLKQSLRTLPHSFDLLRKNYHQRREFTHYQVRLDDPTLKVLGFVTEKSNV